METQAMKYMSQSVWFNSLTRKDKFKRKNNTNLRTRTPTTYKPRSALAYTNDGFEFMIRDLLLSGDAQK